VYNIAKRFAIFEQYFMSKPLQMTTNEFIKRYTIQYKKQYNRVPGKDLS